MLNRTGGKRRHAMIGAEADGSPRRRTAIGRAGSLYYTVAFYAALVVFGATCLLWSLPASLLYRVLPRRVGEPLGQFGITAGFRWSLWMMRALGVVRVDLSPLDALRDEGSLVVAANHPTMMDAVLLISRLPRVVCITKASLWDNAFLGGGVRLAGYVRNDAPLPMIRRAAAAVREGRQLMVFPEGSRTGRPPLDPLQPRLRRDGAGRGAADPDRADRGRLVLSAGRAGRCCAGRTCRWCSACGSASASTRGPRPGGLVEDWRRYFQAGSSSGRRLDREPQLDASGPDPELQQRTSARRHGARRAGAVAGRLGGGGRQHGRPPAEALLARRARACRVCASSSSPRTAARARRCCTGCREAATAGFTHALTMDADGQHPAELHSGVHGGRPRPSPKRWCSACRCSARIAPALRVRGRARVQLVGRARDRVGRDWRLALAASASTRSRRSWSAMGETRWMRRFDFDPEAAVRLSWQGVRAVNLPRRCATCPRPRGWRLALPLLPRQRAAHLDAHEARARGAAPASGPAPAADGLRRGRHRLPQRHRPEPGRRDLAKKNRQSFEHHGARPSSRMRATLPSCSSRMSPAARPRPRRRAMAAGSRRTVSKPRRVQATWARPMPARTGSSSGLRRPMGGRKKRGASPAASAIARCPAATSRRIAPKGRAAKALRWRSVWFSALWPRPHQFPRQRGVPGGAAADQEKGGGRAVRFQQVQHARGDLRVRSVVEGERDLAAPARLLRQAEEVGAEQAVARKQSGDPERGVVGEDGAERPGPGRRVRGEAQGGAGVQPAGRAHHRCGRPVAARRGRLVRRGLEHPEAAAASVSRARSCGRRGRPVHGHAAGWRRAGGGPRAHAARAQTTRSRP